MMTEEAIRDMDAMELIDSFREVCRYGKPESFDDMIALANLIKELYVRLTEGIKHEQRSTAQSIRKV